MAHSYIIRKTLGIKDRNIHLEEKMNEKKIKGTNHLIYYGKLTYTPSACENCGVIHQSSADIVKNGTKESVIKLTHINFKPVLLKLKKQRFYCKHCHTTFIAKTSLVNRHCHISNIIKATITLELTETQSRKLIAQHLNISSHTVLRQLDTIGMSQQFNYHYLPEHLSIDEFKSVKDVNSAMSLLVIDARTHQPIDIVENRQQNYLLEYFGRYSVQARLKVKTVTIDMYSPFIQVIENSFPNAEIIIDRFHIVQLLNRALNQIRIQEMKKIRYLQPRDYRKLKKQWRLLLKNEWQLNYSDYYTNRLYQGYISEKMMVEYLLSLSPELSKTYRLANRLRWSLENRQFQQFKESLMNSKLETYPRKMRTALTSLEKYLDSIENAFTYTLSNGPIEGINNKIKTIKRSGYGYRSFKNLRNRVLVSFNLVQSVKKPKALYYKSS